MRRVLGIAGSLPGSSMPGTADQLALRDGVAVCPISISAALHPMCCFNQPGVAPPTSPQPHPPPPARGAPTTHHPPPHPPHHHTTPPPRIDAIMAQLRQQGWMHHLARHSVACFLTRGDLWCRLAGTQGGLPALGPSPENSAAQARDAL